MTSENNTSEIIKKRIMTLQTDISYYRNSIQGLKESVKYYKCINSSPHAPRVIKYSSIPRSEKNFQWTLQNITSQMQLLEKELEILLKYCC